MDEFFRQEASRTCWKVAQGQALLLACARIRSGYMFHNLWLCSRYFCPDCRVKSANHNPRASAQAKEKEFHFFTKEEINVLSHARLRRKTGGIVQTTSMRARRIGRAAIRASTEKVHFVCKSGFCQTAAAPTPVKLTSRVCRILAPRCWRKSWVNWDLQSLGRRVHF